MTKYIGFLVLTIFTLILLKTFDIALPISVSSSTSSEFSVVGEGKVDVTPDTAYVDIGTSIIGAKTVEEAQKVVNDTNNKIVAALAAIGIAKGDVKTSNYSVTPNYIYDPDNKETAAGYNGNVTISIKVKDIQKIARVIEETTKAGANQIQGTRFVVDNPQKYRDEARDEAIKNAKEQAEKLSKTLGIKLGRITNMYESSDAGSPIGLKRDVAMSYAGGAGSPEIEPGTQTVTSVVTLYFEKK
jgi:uncharacterized protein